jgi:hypothetical protein
MALQPGEEGAFMTTLDKTAFLFAGLQDSIVPHSGTNGEATLRRSAKALAGSPTPISKFIDGLAAPPRRSAQTDAPRSAPARQRPLSLATIKLTMRPPVV